MNETTPPERREILKRARAVRTLAKHRRWAEEMRENGWTVTEPGQAAGPCTAVLPALYPETYPAVWCQLQHGHAGDHFNDPTRWKDSRS